MDKVILTIEGEKKEYPKGITYEEVAEEYQAKHDGLIAVVMEDDKIRELSKAVEKEALVRLITRRESIGHKTYVRTAILTMVKAVADILEAEEKGSSKVKQVKVEYTIGNGYYVSPKGGLMIDQDFIDKVKARMQELVAAKTKINKYSMNTDEAREIFARAGMADKDKLFRYRRGSQVNIYEIDGYQDYYYGYMLPNAGYIREFDLLPFNNGFMLMLPEMSDPLTVQPLASREKLFETLRKGTDWGEKLGIDTVGDLNDRICEGGLSDIILLQEALQERRIAEIAKEIVERGGVKFVMIAGPSSSGKTTFSHRLSVQLASYGLKPHPIAVDDYFVNREDTPKDENGDYNFECLEAIDTTLFNQDMTRLLAGETVELPSFNFKIGAREYKGKYKTLGPEDILVIEGIHALNDKMSLSLPAESKFKIYISALTSLNVDEHNRIPTTDGRLIRRMVRDARTRGASATRTIRMWPSVRRGEEENIFPFQESADAMFNSALIYELAVLKQFAEPLLYSVKKEEPEYYEAKRLLKFLEYFLGVSSENLPNNSIVREFVGGSCFNV
ncbi:MAG: nucleoside kinase [Lachnospiraceae bacterium]|nr:nucleoside kinase [Lachnospiraceae bacterium]